MSDVADLIRRARQAAETEPAERAKLLHMMADALDNLARRVADLEGQVADMLAEASRSDT